MSQAQRPIPAPADPIRDRRAIRAIKATLRRERNHMGYLLFTVGVNSGLRVSELTRLTFADLWTDAGQPRRRLRLEGGALPPGRQDRVNRAINEAMAFYLRGHELGGTGEPVFPISERTVNRWVKRWCERAGLGAGNYSAHTLRKTFAYQVWALNGETYEALAFVQKKLGHKTPGATLDYLGIGRADLHDMCSDVAL